MHDHDDDLIAALAGGHLPSDEIEAARATVASCTRCTAELALQLSARQSLRSLARETLTDFERSRLHHVVDRPVARPWYVRLAPALGAAAGFVLVAGIGATLLGSGAEVAELPADVGEASSDAIAEPAPAAEGIEEPSAAPFDQPTELLRAGAPSPLDFGALTEEGLGSLLESIASEQEAVAEDAFASTFQEESGSGPECLEDTGAPPGAYIGTATLAGERIELYKLTDNRAAAYEPAFCEIVAQFP